MDQINTSPGLLVKSRLVAFLNKAGGLALRAQAWLKKLKAYNQKTCC